MTNLDNANLCILREMIGRFGFTTVFTALMKLDDEAAPEPANDDAPAELHLVSGGN